MPVALVLLGVLASQCSLDGIHHTTRVQYSGRHYGDVSKVRIVKIKLIVNFVHLTLGNLNREFIIVVVVSAYYGCT